MFNGFQAAPLVTFIPTVNFATPGDLSLVYSSQSGISLVQGRLVTVHFRVQVTPTYTTASGTLFMYGLVIPAASISTQIFEGTIQWNGITKTSYTQIFARTNAGQSYLTFTACGSGQIAATVAAADIPTGGALQLIGNIQYII
jgi:hypothetical protein